MTQPEAPRLDLPFQPPVPPMLAALADEIPAGEGWLYEPKWDGFRALVFFDGRQVYLQSRDLRPLGRYFPELEAGLAEVLPGPMVLDGEIVILSALGLDFGALQMRLHPAESRVRRLAEETPAYFVAFDLLADDGTDLREAPFEERRDQLWALMPRDRRPLLHTPSTRDLATAHDWFERFEGAGFDGVVAKRLDQPYRPGVRSLVKVKHARTADCVVGGLRWAKGQKEQAVASLLLGLYDADGVLHHVGHTSSFKAGERQLLASQLEPYIVPVEDDSQGFGRGRTPGAPSRWTGGRDTEWVRLRPELVCEVKFDHLQGDRFRHATTFLRWRPDKSPRECTYDQLETPVPRELRELLGPR